MVLFYGKTMMTEARLPKLHYVPAIHYSKHWYDQDGEFYASGYTDNADEADQISVYVQVREGQESNLIDDTGEDKEFEVSAKGKAQAIAYCEKLCRQKNYLDYVDET